MCIYIYLLIVCGKSMKSPKSSTSQSSLSRASSTCTSFWVCLVKFLKVVKQFFEHGGRQKYLKTPQQPPTGNYSNHIFSVCMYVYICVCMYIYMHICMYIVYTLLLSNYCQKTSIHHISHSIYTQYIYMCVCTVTYLYMLC
jgi:hypothetical protein